MTTNQLQQNSAAIPQNVVLQGNAVPELQLSLNSKNLLIGSSSSIVIDSGLQIVDSDGGNVRGARVSISNITATESLGILGANTNSGTIGTVANGGVINWAYDSNTGVISFTGTATNAAYQDALRQVTYSNTSTTPTTTPISIQFTLGDAAVIAGTDGRYYEYVASPDTSWDTARTAASGKDYFGLTGYLATITSAAENTLVQGVIQGEAWLGGSDSAVEGEWRWVTGPEGLANNNTGTSFWSGGVNGSVAQGGFANWLPQSSEPGGGTSENYMAQFFNLYNLPKGSWFDYAENGQGGWIQGYVVEYGGFAGDPTTPLNLSASISINLTDQSPVVVTDNNIIWRNRNTGENAIWQIDDATLTDSQFITTVADRNWTMVAASADFNGDGKDDLLWRNYTTGENAIWLKDGANLNSFSADGQKFLTRVTDTDWKMITAADFNGDGKADILWRNSRTGENAIWFIDANTITSDSRYASNEQFFTSSLRFIDISWEMVGAGNFDADNKADIVWRNKVTGENAIWLMDGTTGSSVVDGTVGTPVASKASGEKFITTVADSNWKIVGIGDFNGDNQSDLVWRNSSTGENAIWTVNTTSLNNLGNFSTSEQFIVDENGDKVLVPDSNWRIEAVGDTDGDGKSDLIWRNYGSDENAIWQMNGHIAASAGRQLITNGSSTTILTGDLNWEIIDSHIA